uniref:Nuclear receptor domain-containing protein n=1 Tax=Meloidogyne javanica TaxID=6303 RepID=A0A915LUF5_MELJA
MTESQEKQLYNEGEEDSPRCAVCSDQAQGLHFGVMVCRACAAFFRRSTIAKRVYQCRYSGNCQINFREVRCSCRACRFARCISLGMDPNDSGNVSATSSVFSSPLNPASANGHTNQSTSSSNILSMISPQTSESWLYNNPTSTSYINILNTCCSSSDNYSLDNKSTNYYPSLNEMLKGYLKLENKNYSYKKDENEEGKEIIMKEGNYTENVDSIKAESFSVSEMIEEHFFKLLNSNNFNSETRWTMLRNFFFPFILAYRSFVSSKCFPNPEDTRLIATPGKTFFDVCQLQR